MVEEKPRSDFFLTETEKLLISLYSIWVSLRRHFFFKKKGQWKKFYQKRLNSSEHHPSELSRNHEEKDTSNWKIEFNYSQPVKTMQQIFEMKEKKKEKTTLNLDTILVFL